MKKSYPFLITLLLGVFFVFIYQNYIQKDEVIETPQNVESYSGEQKNYRDDNSLQSILNFKDGFRHGVCRSYYEDGKRVHNEIRYIKGVKEGITNSYYRNGKIYYSINYNKGKRNGTMKKYYDSGELMAEIPYADSKPLEGLKEYKKNGDLKKKYPKLRIDEIDNTAFESKYVVKFSLSDGKKKVKFYLTEFDQYGNKLNERKLETEGGVAKLVYFVGQNQEIKRKLKVRAVYTTYHNNPYVMNREKNLHIRW